MKVFTLITIVALAFAVNAQAFTDGSPKMDLKIGSITIESACNSSDSFKKGGPQTLGGPGAGPGPSNVLIDCYTAPSWATTSPSYFSIEQYSFPVSASYIDHRIVLNNSQGPWPTPISLAYVWQRCGNGKIFPPVPSTIGTNAPWDGYTLFLSLPYGGNCWNISLMIGGFSTGTWDWMALARYDGVTPIPVLPPGDPSNDCHGGDLITFDLYSVSDRVGDGYGANRPWCFQVY
jgi:hypothetical protein